MVAVHRGRSIGTGSTTLRSCAMDGHFTLPQPRGVVNNNESPFYRYLLYEQVQEVLFDSNLKPGTLCWVLKSKGLPKSKRRDDDTTSCTQRAELFMRARVVQDEEEEEHSIDPQRRVLVRYPRGSTYQVKRCNLLPVLEPPDHNNNNNNNLVLIMAETPEYRRASVLHTCIGDSFLEIGCDYGACVDRVHRALQDISGVPRDPDDGPESLPPPCDEDNKNRVWCLGIDKSIESVDIAKNQYPECAFSVEDALTVDGVRKLQKLCQTKLHNMYPSVVAIDINGNREIPAVLQCLDNILNPPTTCEEWILPRIVLVKSRLLHIALRQNTSTIINVPELVQGTPHVLDSNGLPHEDSA